MTVAEARTIPGHPEHAKIRAYRRAYYVRHKDKLVAASVQWRKDNLARAHVNEAAYRARNLDRARWHKAARRVDTGPEEREYMRVLLNDPCSYCGGPAGSIDHITPIAAGGTGGWDNLTAACRSCNSSKGARSLLDHLSKVG